MKNNPSVIGLFSVSLLLSLGQAAKAAPDIPPIVISYFDAAWNSVPQTADGYATVAGIGMNVINSVQPDGPYGYLPVIDHSLAQQYGLRTMIDWDHWGTEVIPNDPAFLDQRAQDLVNAHSAYSDHLGFRLRDEPSADEFPQIGMLHQKLLQYDPDCLPWCNILPNYSSNLWGEGISTHKQYLDAYMTQVQPKVLSYDDYSSMYNTTYPENVYPAYNCYSNLERFREYGKAYNIPYWRIIGTNFDHTSPNTEGIYRQQMYTSLAYGFTGISYFRYMMNTDGGLTYGWGATGHDWGDPTPYYAIAQEVNQEVMKLAPILGNLTSWSVHHTDYNSAGMTAPSWTPAEDKETFNGIDGFYVSNITGGEMVYGQLVDDNGKTYLMFVNKDYVNGHTFNFSLNYSSSPLYNGLARVDKNTGKLVIADTDGYLSRYLAAGDGELFRILNDTTAASTPDNLRLIDQEMTSLVIDWSNSSDPQSGIDFYYIYRDGVEVGTSPGSYFTDTGLLPGKSYSYRVSAVNGEGLETYRSLPVLWATTLTMPGDANNDGVVDDKDATILAANWLTSSGASWADGDFNNDGAVDDKDASILAANWGNDVTAAASVPEPGMLMLLAGLFFVLKLRPPVNRF